VGACGRWPRQIEALAEAARLLPETREREVDALLARAMAVGRAEVRRTHAAAEALSSSAHAHYDRGHWEQASALLREALAAYEKRGGDSPGVAACLLNLGLLARKQGAPAQARGYYERSLAIQQAAGRESLIMAGTLGDLGYVARDLGDWPGARDYFERGLRIQQKLAPASLIVATSLSDLGAVAEIQGNLAEAKEYHRQALALRQNLARDSLDMATSLNNLGVVASDQGDWTGAREYFSRALTLRQNLAHDSPDMASTLGNLGVATQEQGDLAGAQEYYERALRIQQHLAPDSSGVAALLNNLGILAAQRGDRAGARRFYQQSLAIEQKLVPNSLGVATILTNLGTLTEGQGDLPKARELYQRAFAIRQQLAPDSLSMAQSLRNLGLVARKQGRWAEAEHYALWAWRIVRRQANAVTGDEARQSYGASNVSHAADLLRTQLALSHTAAAVLTLEESRAQALQQLLLERHQLLAAVAGPLAVAYQEALAERDRAEGLLSRVHAHVVLAERQFRAVESRPTSPDAQALRTTRDKASREFKEAQSAYTRARLAVEARWEAIKRANPRAFAPPLPAQEALRALPPSTVYLAFLVGAEQSHLFLLRSGRLPQALAVYTLPVKAEALEMNVAQLRWQLTSPRPNRASTTRASRALFATLFPPAARPTILRAKRLLIAPDGPLWQVSFAALVTNAQGPPRYLGATTPISLTPSLTLFAQVRRSPPHHTPGVSPTALVVGNPQFERRPAPRPGAALLAAALPVSRQGEIGEVLQTGTAPAALPHAAAEAAAVARLYGTRSLTGAAATEAAVRAQSGKADVIHLATHGLLDTYRAMSSAVLLAAPEADHTVLDTANDGLLQAWEIYSQLPLQADLVVLSACETGEGEHVRSEGLVGLTRALQAAGARSIVASLWPVADASTERLMVTFHRKLREGLAKDEALQQAMAAVRSDPATADPRYWAAFFLLGDPDNGVLGTLRSPIARSRGARG
jgi:CHAT domain-containing protein